MITRKLTPKGWVITELENEKDIFNHRHVAGAGTNSRPDLTASERELSKKLLHTQSELLLVLEKVDKIETVIESVLIARGSSNDRATR